MPQGAATVILLAVIWCTGCTTAPGHKDLAAFLKAHEHKVSATELRVAAGDTIVIDAPRIHEISENAILIEPDGKIALRLIGDVKVAGLTAREIASKLKELFSLYYRDPEIYVRIVDQPTQVYYVLGQVRRVGIHPYTGRDTLVRALVNAQLTEIAWRSKVKVIRPSPNDAERHKLEINVDKMLKEGDTRLNILLEPGDVVYVPPTPLGWIGLKVREMLFPITPVLQAYATPLDAMAIDEEYQSGVDVAGRARTTRR